MKIKHDLTFNVFSAIIMPKLTNGSYKVKDAQFDCLLKRKLYMGLVINHLSVHKLYIRIANV